MDIYVSNERVKYERVLREYRFGERNEAGEKILNFASSYELVNTYFKKREESLYVII
jgi:hypothetical protein